MKKCLLFLLMLTVVANFDLHARRQIELHNSGQAPSHFELPAPADMPDIYYDDNTCEIIIDGLGVVDYYDVEIASATSFITVITTQVNGSYDTIDISSLPQGEYVITIESPWGNTYEGFFEIL